MAKWSSEGKEVILCVVTNGAAGSNDPQIDRERLIAIREEEQKEAAAITGIADLVFLGYEDGFVEDSHELRRDIIREIRRFKPDIAIGPDPSTFYFVQRYVNHPDHRKVGEAFLAAVNPGSATVPLYRSELFERGFEPHELAGCLLGMTNTPDYFVDVSDFIEVKIKAIEAHRSQFLDFGEVAELIRQMGKATAELAGQEHGYSEGFKAFFFRRPGEGSTGEELPATGPSLH